MYTIAIYICKLLALHQQEKIAVMMSSLRNESSSDEVDAICEIFAEAILLKSKLEHSIYKFLQDIITISVNTIHLLESAITYLHSIQLQIYVRKCINCVC